MKRSIHIKGTELDLSRPKVMGILNVTPDSFSDGGKFYSLDAALFHAESLVSEGAHILDIGGYSSRPGATDVSVLQELDRVIPVIQKVAANMDVIISVDTFRSEVAKEAVISGASMVNDISAGQDDTLMIATVAKLGVPFIAMHKKGVPLNMQHKPEYGDVVQEVYDYLLAIKKECHHAGIKQVIIDPGFGFGKTIEHNYTLLKQLKTFESLDLPILIGLSRKSMIYKTLGVSPVDALNGTSFLHGFALQGGASILRVHDVKAAVECVRLFDFF